MAEQVAKMQNELEQSREAQKKLSSDLTALELEKQTLQTQLFEAEVCMYMHAHTNTQYVCTGHNAIFVSHPPPSSPLPSPSPFLQQSVSAASSSQEERVCQAEAQSAKLENERKCLLAEQENKERELQDVRGEEG